jgi:hypothetical protein
MALRLISSSPRRTAVLPPSFPGSVPLGNLTPAPRHQDHTTSPYASATLVRRSLRVHRISPHVRDDREAPFIRRETRGNMPLICPTARAEYFCARGWTDFGVICPSCQLVAPIARHRHCEPTGRRGAPPDDSLREAIHSAACGSLDFLLLSLFVLRPRI